MILAGSGDDVNKELDKLAALADKVLDVSTPLVSAVPTSTAVEELRAEIAVLKTLVKSQQKHSSQQPQQKPHLVQLITLVTLVQFVLSLHNLRTTHFAGTTVDSRLLPRSVNYHVPGRKTTRPGTDGDQ